MPIRINLLAEAQAAEELRRKDPVKRAILMGIGCAILMALASLVIQVKIIGTKSKADKYAKQIKAITNQYAAVMADRADLEQVRLNIRGLDILASERFLQGSLLNALQKVYVDHVQLVHLHIEQTYTLAEATRDKKNLNKIIHPATSTEKLSLLIEARDSSPNPGDQVNKYKQALGNSPAFQSLLGTNTELRLVTLSPPHNGAVQFTLESRPPEKVRLGVTSPVRYGTAPVAGKRATARASTSPLKL